ncbi:MAG: hypothetical protein VR67_12115 [Peptococcaceae bacterium BRH_c8a]|nr:MAG: hypothetical protein VR67_12115 [Peptococcaceae bacterium BRH_c8a]
MKCYTHNDEAVVTCTCGNGLCAECAGQYPVCQTCAELNNKQHLEALKKSIVRTLLIAAVGLVIGNIMSGDVVFSLQLTWTLLGVYWGWTLVKPLLFATVVGGFIWGINATMTGFLLIFFSVLLGLVLGPFLLARQVYLYQRQKKNIATIKSLGTYSFQ